MKIIYSIIVILVLAPISNGQRNLGDEVPQAIELMREKRWIEAQIILFNIVDQMAERGEQLFGEKFGVVYYNKGYCELQLAKESKEVVKKNEYYKMASDSMKECFEIHMRANKVHSKSLLYRAQAEQGLGNMETAIELNKLFLEARSKE
jgi:hypothetical protein